MAADTPVGLPLHQQKLAVGRRHALGRIRHIGRRIGQRQFAENQRHQGPLDEPADDLARRIAQHPGLVPRGFVDGAVQGAGLVNGIGVGEQQPPAPGLARRGPDGIALAGPTLFEPRRFHQGHAGKGARDLRGAVGGIVIDHDQFPVAPQLEDLFRLPDQGLKAGADAVLFVARRDNHRQFEQRLRLRLVEDGSRPGPRIRAAPEGRPTIPAPASTPASRAPRCFPADRSSLAAIRPPRFSFQGS